MVAMLWLQSGRYLCHSVLMSMSKDGRARIIRQRLILLRQVQGIPFIEEGKLWLLSRPSKRPSDCVRLAHLLLAEEEPAKDELAQLLGAKETIFVDDKALNRWSRAAELVGNWRNLNELMKDGVRGLRGWTEEEVRHVASEAREKVDNLYAIFRGLAQSEEVASPIEPIARCCARVAEYFEDAALVERVRKALEAPHVASETTSRRFRVRVSRFIELLEISKSKLSFYSNKPLERELVQACRAQRRRRKINPQFLARMFAKWLESMGEGERPIALRDLTRAMRKAWIEGLRQAIWAAANAWVDGRVKSKPPADNLLLWRVAIVLANPTLELAIPEDFTKQQFRRLIELVTKVRQERAPLFRELFIELAAKTKISLDVRLFNSELDLSTIARAYALGASPGAIQLCKDPKAVRRYLEALEKLQGLEIKDKDYLHRDWFVSLFKNSLLATSALPLVMLTKERSSHIADGEIASLYALAKGLVAHRDLLSEPLELWTNPKLDPLPSEFDDLLNELALDEAELTKYVVYRKMIGNEECFSKELLAVLHQRKRDEDEARYLTTLLVKDELTDEKRERLAKRLASLQSEENQARRRHGAINRGRRLFERSLKELSRQSLEALLDNVYHQLLSELLQCEIKTPLPKGIREALQLVATDNRNFSLFLELLRHIVEESAIEGRDENQEWLDNASKSGLDGARWLKGLQSEITIYGDVVSVATEHSPLEILKMGSYFGTCLSLDDGFNAASTVLNALDINKQVIYARDEKGNVVGRKLIAATSDGKAVAFETYGFSELPQVEAHFDLAVADYCQECGLKLQDKGEAEKIHKGFWYDDGSVAWRHTLTGKLSPIPSSLPQTSEAQLEYHFSRGLEEGDYDELWAVGREAPSSSSLEDSVALRLWNKDPQRAFEYCRLQPWSGWDTVLECLVNKGEVAWLRNPHLKALNTVCERVLENSLNAIPFQEEKCVKVVNELLRYLHKVCPELSGYGHEIYPPMRLARMPVKSILRFLEGLLKILPERVFESFDSWGRSWSDIVYYAFLRENSARDLVSFLKKGSQHIVDVIAEVATRTRLKGSADSLKSHLATAHGGRQETLALALGTQGRKKDGPFLLELLKGSRNKVKLALAVVRTSHKECSRQAREIWRPLPSLTSMKTDNWALSFIRELGGEQFSRRLKRMRKRLRNDGEETSALSEKQIDLLLAKVGRLDKNEAERPAPYFQELVSSIGKMKELILGDEQEQVQACQWYQKARNAKLTIYDLEFDLAFDQLVARGAKNPIVLDVWFRTRHSLSAEHFLAVAGAEAVSCLPEEAIEEYLEKRMQHVYKAIDIDRFLLFLSALPREKAQPYMKRWHVRGEAKRALEDEFFGGIFTQFLEDKEHPLFAITWGLITAASLGEGEDVQIVLDDLRLWLKPQVWEELARETLRNWLDKEPSDCQLEKFLTTVKSYLLVELFIEEVWSSLARARRQLLIDGMQSKETENNKPWLMRSLKASVNQELR